jgi:hypothetical protein
MFLAVIPMLLSHMAALARPAAVAALEREGRAPFLKNKISNILCAHSQKSVPRYIYYVKSP